MRRAGVSGAVPRNTSDLLMVTTQNAAANKLDTYLSRDVRLSGHDHANW